MHFSKQQALKLEAFLDKKYKIHETELYNWIHHNYSSIFLTNEELPLMKLALPPFI